jgi:hypothetical protein
VEPGGGRDRHEDDDLDPGRAAHRVQEPEVPEAELPGDGHGKTLRGRVEVGVRRVDRDPRAERGGCRGPRRRFGVDATQRVEEQRVVGDEQVGPGGDGAAHRDRRRVEATRSP